MRDKIKPDEEAWWGPFPQKTVFFCNIYPIFDKSGIRQRNPGEVYP